MKQTLKFSLCHKVATGCSWMEKQIRESNGHQRRQSDPLYKILYVPTTFSSLFFSPQLNKNTAISVTDIHRSLTNYPIKITKWRFLWKLKPFPTEQIGWILMKSPLLKIHPMLYKTFTWIAFQWKNYLRQRYLDVAILIIIIRSH